MRGYLLGLQKEHCSQVHCPSTGCTKIVIESTMRQVLSTTEMQSLLDMTAITVLENDKSYIKCPNGSCQQIFEKVDQPRDHIIRKLVHERKVSILLSYQILTLDKKFVCEAEIHKEQHRFSCRSCKTEFCSKCLSIPYHEGKTCEDYKRFLAAKHCRFCGDVIPPPNKFLRAITLTSPATMDVCDKHECVQKRNRICQSVLKCGHACCGIRGEKECLPCIHEDCASMQNLHHNGNEYCNICFVDKLNEGPCLYLKCGHIFHEACIRKKLGSKWPGARITFGFMDCPLCKRTIEHSSLNDITEPLNKIKQLIFTKFHKRLQIENPLDIRDKISEQDKLDWAYHNFAYYLCYRCNDPYYGGRRQCDMNLGDGNDKFDEKELVCGSCQAKEFGQKQSCKKHGTEYLEYKCKFCCNIAIWYCWGNTHFCNNCHEIQCKTHRLTRKSKSELPKCSGPGKCPIGGNHGDNGEEMALGCSICRRATVEDY
jgi:hypothetical protein